MTDYRFPSPGVDLRHPSPGEDWEHDAYPVDRRFPSPGVDTRFDGGYGGGGGGPGNDDPPDIDLYLINLDFRKASNSHHIVTVGL